MSVFQKSAAPFNLRERGNNDMSVEHELNSLRHEVKELKDQMKELKKMKQVPRAKRAPTEYALFVQKYAQAHKGDKDLMKNAGAEWRKKHGAK